jgi:glycolate oxidase
MPYVFQNHSKMKNIAQLLENTLGKDFVFTNAEKRQAHSQDKSGLPAFLPDIVVEPADTEGVSAVLKICNEHRVPVTVQGGLSGVSGGALPIAGGVALSMRRMDKILSIDSDNFQVTVEPAVITEHLQNVLKTKGLFYPPDPAGRGWSFIGGNIGTNAGGPKCCKYGVTRDYVLNLEIVLASGEVMWTGANTLKNSTEGTLAVVTKIVLKLLPHPQFNLLLLAPFNDPADAVAAVSAIYQAGVLPSALEFMEDGCVAYAARYVGIEPLSKKHQLLIEVDGNDLNILHKDCETIAQVLQNFNVDDIFFADSEAQKNDLWRLRRNAGGAVLALAQIKLSEDAVVPRAQLPELLRGVKNIGQTYNVDTLSLGHLGDGNLHIYIYSDDEPDAAWKIRSIEAKRAVFELVKSLNGMLSAEHGVGYAQVEFLDIFLGETHRQILRGIKNVFDPNGILNPHKIV